MTDDEGYGLAESDPIPERRREEAYEVILGDHDGVVTRWCLECGVHRTVDRYARVACDRCYMDTRREYES